MEKLAHHRKKEKKKIANRGTGRLGSTPSTDVIRNSLLAGSPGFSVCHPSHRDRWPEGEG